MKRNGIILLLSAFFACSAFAQDIDVEDEGVTEAQETKAPVREKVFPAPKRPQKPSQEALTAAKEKNPEHASSEYEEECNDTFLYGLTDEIVTLLDELTSDEDVRFADSN